MKPLVPVLCCALLAGACASSRANRPIAVPDAQRIYVSVFVDESPRGEVGVPLADALRVEIYRRDPSRLAMTFDEGAVAVDGTVHSVEEQPAGAGQLSVVVEAGARLVNRDGAVIADLGRAEAEGVYRPRRERAATDAARSQAIEAAVQRLARELIRRVDDAGRDRAGEGGRDAA